MLLQGQIKSYRSKLQLQRGRPDGGATAETEQSEKGAQSGMDLGTGTGKFRLENELRENLSRGRLDMRYQPMLDIGSNRVSGFEAFHGLPPSARLFDRKANAIG